MNGITAEATSLLAMVGSSFQFDSVDFSDLQMCAKCVGGMQDLLNESGKCL